MKTKPFNTHDVQAIILGRKTMFREAIRIQPPDYRDWKLCTVTDTTGSKRIIGKHFWSVFTNNHHHENTSVYFKHRYAPGDIIAVKETWSKLVPEHFITTSFVYKADITSDGEEIRQQYIKQGYPYAWHSPVFMPPEAHRIFLEVVSVKVERFQDISSEDCIKEGVKHLIDSIRGYLGYDYRAGEYYPSTTPSHGFMQLHPDQWQRNEWVFAYEFRRIEK